MRPIYSAKYHFVIAAWSAKRQNPLPVKSRFQFNEGKSDSNKRRHGIDFVEARKIWNSPTFEFPLQGGPEMRYLVLGTIDGEHYTAIITYRGGSIRIISVRPSNDTELRQYEISSKKAQKARD